MTKPIALSLAALLTLLCACSAQPVSAPEQPTPSAPAPRGGMVMNNVIVIAKSSSTNLIGYRILVSATGDATFVAGNGPGGAALPPNLHARLKADVATASPLSQIPSTSGCAKPASFASETTIALGGEHSPDLSCSNDPKAQVLMTDIAEIVAFLKIRDVPRSEGHELPPQNF
jgi:hypothetical protein